MTAGATGGGHTPPAAPKSAADHWAALGYLAAAARGPADPKDVKIKDLVAQIETLTSKITLAEGRLKNREESLDRASAVIDDQAAQIVDLQGKVALARPVTPEEQGRLERMLEVEDELRDNLERAETRCMQLVAAWPKGTAVPAEPIYTVAREGGSWISLDRASN